MLFLIRVLSRPTIQNSVHKQKMKLLHLLLVPDYRKDNNPSGFWGKKKQTYIVGRMLYRREIGPDRHMGQSGPKRKSPHGSVQISRQVGRWSVKAHTHHKIFHYGPCHTRGHDQITARATVNWHTSNFVLNEADWGDVHTRPYNWPTPSNVKSDWFVSHSVARTPTWTIDFRSPPTTRLEPMA